MLTLYNNTHNKVLLCLTNTSLYIYICVKHFGMANIKVYECCIYGNETLDFVTRKEILCLLADYIDL